MIMRIYIVGFTTGWFFLWGHFAGWDLNFMLWQHDYSYPNGFWGMVTRLVVGFILLVASMIVTIMPAETHKKR